jgi:hypothetical protein
MAKHTPGEWEVWGGGLNIRTKNNQKFIACCGASGYDQEELKANARLIAAAPELLEALKIAYSADFRQRLATDAQLNNWEKQIITAISKAEGK